MDPVAAFFLHGNDGAECSSLPAADLLTMAVLQILEDKIPNQEPAAQSSYQLGFTSTCRAKLISRRMGIRSPGGWRYHSCGIGAYWGRKAILDVAEERKRIGIYLGIAPHSESWCWLRTCACRT